ncbi:MAG TPA: hypothetical protein VK616_06750 [Flavitalea sp.]|nr:hypothetical protein [Flavitalea sp.]HTF31905.1 hypothetical protein [Flavitalea sp.]
MNSILPEVAAVERLISLHEVNIRNYKKILHEALNLKGDMKSIFERIVEESTKCRNELVHYKKELSYEKGITEKNEGKEVEIPKGVSDNPITSIEDDVAGNRKTILSHCQDDILKVLNYYTSLQSMEMRDETLRAVLTDQFESENKLYMHIAEFSDAQ